MQAEVTFSRYADIDLIYKYYVSIVTGILFFYNILAVNSWPIFFIVFICALALDKQP